MAAQKNAIFLLALIANLGHFSASLAVAEDEQIEEVERGYYESEGFQEILRKLEEKYPKLRLHRRSPGEVRVVISNFGLFLVSVAFAPLAPLTLAVHTERGIHQNTNSTYPTRKFRESLEHSCYIRNWL